MEGYYIGYSTDPLEKVHEIGEYINKQAGKKKRASLVIREIQENEHEMGDYPSIDIYWKNGYEWTRLKQKDPEYNQNYFDDERQYNADGKIVGERMEELSNEILELHKMEDDIKKKFKQWL